MKLIPGKIRNIKPYLPKKKLNKTKTLFISSDMFLVAWRHSRPAGKRGGFFVVIGMGHKNGTVLAVSHKV